MKKPKFIVSILLFIGFILILVGCSNPSYTVSFIVNDETETAITTEGSLSELPEGPSIKGYTFDGWYLDEEYKVELTISTEITSDINAYAKYNVITYTIEYKDTEGVANNNPSSYNIESDTIKLSDLSRPGYKFDGWYNGETKVDEIKNGSIGDFSVSAHWTKSSYSISYENLKGATNENTGGFDVDTPDIDINDLGDVTGYTFAGWIDETGAPVTSIPQGTTKNYVLTAQWVLVDYKINYVDELNVDHNNPKSYNIESTTIILDPLSKTGYEFEGWFNGDNKVEKIETGSTGILTLTAHWKKNSYSISYNNTKGADNSKNPDGFSVTTETILLNKLPDVTGYKFLGWKDKTGALVTSIPQGSTESVVLTAEWELNTYTITYINEVGLTNPASTTYSIESTEIVLPTISDETYTLVGWYDANGDLVEEVLPTRLESFTLKSKLIETAKINRIQYTEDLSFKPTDTITLSNFNPSCFNDKGVYYDTILCTVNGEMTVGNTISVTLSIPGVDTVTINNIKIYGTPTLESDYSSYIYADQVNETSFTALDTFGSPATLQFPENFNVGDTITITAVDPAGNTTSKEYLVERASTEVFKISIGTVSGLTDYGKELENIIIPNTISDYEIRTIDDNAFKDNEKLTTIILPNTLIDICNSAFRNCINLKEINIPKSVERIRTYAFSGCTNLATLDIDEGVQKINMYAFQNCTSLTSVVIPSTVTILDGSVFQNCTSLKDFTLLSTQVTDVNCLSGCSSLTTVNLPTGVTTLGGFLNCTSLVSITIPTSVKVINNLAFSGCSSLTSINLELVETIQDSAFDGCSSLKNIDLSSITYLGSSFSYCNELEGVILPLSLTTIKSYTFYGCISLTEIIIPSKVETIGDYAFGNCRGLTSIIIPESVTTMGSKVFQNLSSLTIYCEIAEADKPSTWDSSWYSSSSTVIWNYKAEETN